METNKDIPVTTKSDKVDGHIILTVNFVNVIALLVCYFAFSVVCSKPLLQFINITLI
jgi:hypothetical protein